jgi:hypothetical protein
MEVTTVWSGIAIWKEREREVVAAMPLQRLEPFVMGYQNEEFNENTQSR